ncbi:MAG TPA: hypothetical protein GYA08_21400 [Chloroflexi bacterium]|nr:hypothetical protein [Chloroflexota bacterium]
MDERQQVDLLRRYEPIIRFTHGEEFFPMDAEAYIRACSLWIKRPGEPPQEVASASQVTPETLAAPIEESLGAVRYLKFTEPLSAAEMAVQALRQRRKGEPDAADFQIVKGRLVRVGYLSRVVDGLFRVALLVRGRVPGDAAAAASLGYRTLLEQGHRHVYHGRVVEESGWTVLQYWFFYLYNNWRSRFSGANDHEADWEMICIYLAPDGNGELQPEWVAYASHDYTGDDLRRHWRDPEVEKVGEHPVIYAGAGSHAAYFRAGEYLTKIELNALAPITRATRQVQRAWKRLMREPETPAEDAEPVLAIPFVDYARGDGLVIGPGGDEPWATPVRIDETVGWVQGYRGLWGLYTQDPFAGEDAPAGPMYNRDGTVRRAWYDPVGWAGLDKVAPTAATLELLRRQRQQLVDHRTSLRAQVTESTAALRGLDVQATAIRTQPHLRSLYAQLRQKITQQADAIAAIQADIAATNALLENLDHHAAHLQAGGGPPPRAHIQRAHTPAASDQARSGQVAELWAAISVTVLLVAFVLLFAFNPRFLPVWLVAILALFTFIEASVRGTFTRVVGSFATALAIAAALVLLYEFFWWVVGALILALALYILWDNLRELTRSWRA